MRHSLSPAIHNAAFAAAGLDWVYVAFEVPDGGAPGAVEAMRALGLGGMSVTMPHKAAVVPALDRCEGAAAVLGVVNCIVPDGGALVGHNTDGEGFLRGLRADFDLDPSGARCAVLGAGGAARAVVLALAEAGADHIDVVGRDRVRAEACADLAPSVARVAGADVVADADLVVNATPVGMGEPADRGLTPVPGSALSEGQVVADLVYHPAETALMRAAAATGARTSNGLSMLVHQAAVAFELWTGAQAPVEAMARAASEAIAGEDPAES